MSGEDTPQRSPKQIEAAKKNLKPAWQPGQSGNPAGRPKGARNKLSEDFFQVLMKDFEENGVKAIELMRAESPKDYAKMIASLQSKELTGEDGAALFTGLDVNVKR